MAESNDSIPVLKDIAENVYIKQSEKPENKKAIFYEAVSTVPYESFNQKSQIFDVINNIDPLYFNNKDSLDTMIGKNKSQVESLQSAAE